MLRIYTHIKTTPGKALSIDIKYEYRCEADEFGVFGCITRRESAICVRRDPKSLQFRHQPPELSPPDHLVTAIFVRTGREKHHSK